MIHLLCSSKCRCFPPFLENFSYILNKHGILSDINFSYDRKNDDGDLWLVIWNGISTLPKRCIVFNYDPMVPHVENLFRSLLSRSPNTKIEQFIDYCYGFNREKLKNLELPYWVLPYGYSPYYQHLKTSYVSSDTKKDIDVLFFGTISPRRSKILDELSSMCSQKGYTLAIKNDLYDDSEKTNLFARSKIVVSIASLDAKAINTNDLARLSQILSTGGFAISEYIGDTLVENKISEYAPHYNTANELLEKVDYYLSNPKEIEALTAKATNKFSKEFDFENQLVTLVSALF